MEFFFSPRDGELLHRIPENVVVATDFLSPDIKMGRDTEYYRSVGELTFNCPIERLPEVSKFLKLVSGKVTSSQESQVFVGTHLHIFDAPFCVLNTSLELDFHVYNKLINLIKNTSVWDNADELYRLTAGHQILGRMNQNTRYTLDTIRREYRLDQLLYRQRQAQSKYCAVYHSPSTRSGKPDSLEIRIIPNLLLLENPELIQQFLEDVCDDIVNNRIEKTAPFDFTAYTEALLRYCKLMDFSTNRRTNDDTDRASSLGTLSREYALYIEEVVERNRNS